MSDSREKTYDKIIENSAKRDKLFIKLLTNFEKYRALMLELDKNLPEKNKIITSPISDSLSTDSDSEEKKKHVILKPEKRRK